MLPYFGTKAVEIAFYEGPMRVDTTIFHNRSIILADSCASDCRRSSLTSRVLQTAWTADALHDRPCFHGILDANSWGQEMSIRSDSGTSASTLSASSSGQHLFRPFANVGIREMQVTVFGFGMQ